MTNFRFRLIKLFFLISALLFSGIVSAQKKKSLDQVMHENKMKAERERVKQYYDQKDASNRKASSGNQRTITYQPNYQATAKMRAESKEAKKWLKERRQRKSTVKSLRKSARKMIRKSDRKYKKSLRKDSKK